MQINCNSPFRYIYIVLHFSFQNINKQIRDYMKEIAEKGISGKNSGASVIINPDIY